MRVSLRLLLTTLLFLSEVLTPAMAVSREQALTKLESQNLGITYPKDTPENRIKRLEENILGQVSSGSVDARIEKLNKIFEVKEAQVPESFKEEIEIASRGPAPSKAPTQNSSKPATKIQLQKNIDDLSEQMLKVINQERSFRSLRPLRPDETANRMALEHASYLAQTKQFSHFGVMGKNPDQRYSEAGGNGKVEELVDGFFAATDAQGNIKPISVNADTAGHLMDALLKVPDKADIVFNVDANAAGVSFVISPDKKQLVVVIEMVADYVSLGGLPTQTPPSSIGVSGTISGGYKFAWIGVAKREDKDEEKIEVEASPYFAPIDKVIYADRTTEKAKKLAQTGGLILAMVAAPFTYGASMLVADILMQTISQAYQAQDVEVRSGVKASDASFNGNVNVGEWGPGLYYISIWAIPSRSKKPVIVSRRTVLVT